MADLRYDIGLDETRDWVSSAFRFLLLKGSGYTPSKTHSFVADLSPGSNEVTASPYARVTAASKARTVDHTNHRIAYTCADPAFGSLATGETVTGMVLFKVVSSDADHILIAYYDLDDTATNGSPFTVALNAIGAIYVDAP